ncbi:MAG: MBOAT family protein [Planctomycetes bacterium]|nr:MBOAT family protein [Planctomycetota bacterium]
MVWLLLASCAFYMLWNPWLILLILFSASIDYAAALIIEESKSPRVRKSLLIGSIAINLGLLFFFKYANFFLDNVHLVFGVFEMPFSRPTLDIILPLGISFYTFETISYIVDVYRGRTKAARNPLDYALFIMFFPHLIAGPIVRPYHFLPQLARPKRFSWERLHLGMRLFLIGLFKKSIIADHLGQQVVDPVFANPTTFGSGALWLAVLAYAVQIYCDFSGYSDMGIGLAHTLGFKLPVNFRFPYLAASMSAFWRRWHISLSTWLRDYLYLPLGGNRAGFAAACRNLMVVMLLGGLWHGANWTFLVWGAYHGFLLVVGRIRERLGLLTQPFWRPLAIVTTFLLVCIGWVFFRAQCLADAQVVLARMAWPTDGETLAPGAAVLVWLCLATTFAGHLFGTRVNLLRFERRVPAPIMGAALAGLLATTLGLYPIITRTFIYFQF